MSKYSCVRLGRVVGLLLAPALLLLSALAAAGQSTPQQTSRATAEQLTSALLALNAQYQAADARRKTQLMSQLLASATGRQQFLISIGATSPSDVLRVAIPASVAATLPGAVRSAVEQEVDVQGELEVMMEDGINHATLHHFLNTGSERLELHFSGEPPADLLTGAAVRVHGVKIGSQLFLNSPSPTSGTTTLQTAATTTTSTALPNTFGVFRTLVIMVNFQDNPTAQPFTAATAQSVLSQTSSWDMENSYQQTSLVADVAGWYTIAVDSTNCATGTIKTDAQAAAQAAGYTLSNYNRFIYLMASNSGCSSWWGYASIGGSDVWINGMYQLTAHVVAHEMGHNFGLYHAHTVDCGAAVVCSSGTLSEYGDPFDTMGLSSYTQDGHFNAFQKERLGWVGSGFQPPVIAVTSSGTYQISPYEAQDGAAKVLKILQSPTSSSYYYVEYRQALGVDSFLSSYSDILNGVVFHLASPSGGNSSDLLDLTPTSPSSFSHPALVVGSSYTDSTAGVTITPVSAGSTASLQVTFGAVACTHASPTVTMSPSQSQWVIAGTAVSFTISVKNNDNSGCSSSTFNLADSVPTGWSALLSNSGITLAPGATGSVALQVTSPVGTVNGFYTVGATATNSSASTYTASASATYVVGTVSISVSTNQTSYSRGQTVTVTVTMLSGSSPDAGASVAVKVTKSNGSVVSLSGTTGSNGTALLSYRLKKTDPVGTYQVTASSASAGSSATISASASFSVQ